MLCRVEGLAERASPSDYIKNRRKTATAFPCKKILFKMKDKQRLVTSEERRKDAPVGLSIWDGNKGNC